MTTFIIILSIQPKSTPYYIIVYILSTRASISHKRWLIHSGQRDLVSRGFSSNSMTCIANASNYHQWLNGTLEVQMTAPCQRQSCERCQRLWHMSIDMTRWDQIWLRHKNYIEHIECWDIAWTLWKTRGLCLSYTRESKEYITYTT